MSIGEPLKKGLSVATGSFPLLLVLFVFGLAWNLINIFYTPLTQNPAAGTSAPVIAIGVVFILLSIYVQAGSFGYVRDRIKSGAASLGSFGQGGAKYYLRMLGIGIIVALVVGLFVVAAALIMAGLGRRSDQQALIGMWLAIVVAAIGIYVMMLMFLAPYVAVTDEQKVLASIKKSIAFVRQNLLNVIVLGLILVVIGFVVGLALGALFALLTAAVKGTPGDVIFAVISSFINSFLGLWVTGCFMTFYLNASVNATNSNNTAGA